MDAHTFESVWFEHWKSKEAQLKFNSFHLGLSKVFLFFPDFSFFHAQNKFVQRIYNFFYFQKFPMMSTSIQLNWKLDSNHTIKRNKMTKKSSFKDQNGRNVKKTTDKYSLRAGSLQKRIEVEGRKSLPKKRGPKPKPKSQPMSKYRRKTANLRERMRMGEINIAFEKLREKIPQSESTPNVGKCEKLTKINILHVAINYIKALESILNTGEAGVQVFGTSVIRGLMDSSHLKVEVTKKSPQPKKIIKKEENDRKKLVGRKVKREDVDDLLLMPVLNDDSGMAEDFEDEHLQEDWPDWTELTSTLDFPTTTSNINMKLLTKPHLDVLLSNIISLQGTDLVRISNKITTYNNLWQHSFCWF